MAYFFQKSLVVSTALALVLTGSVSAQQLQPVLDDNQVETTNLEIQKIYNLTEVARNIDDYERIIGRSEKLLKQEIADKDAKYLTSLVGWSRNRLAQKHLQNAISMKDVGLESQADAELEKATRQFDIVIASSPLTWRAWMGRARIHVLNDEYDLAIDKFVEVTKLKRDHWNAWFNAAEICLQKKRFEDAIEFYSRLIKENPTDAESLTGRGHAYIALEEFPKAIEDYKTVVKLLPKNENALCNLGDAFVRVEMWHEALQQFETAQNLDVSALGGERLANLLISTSDEEIKDFALAIKLTNQLIDKYGPSRQVLITLSNAYKESGKTEMANEVLTRISNLGKRTTRQAQINNSKTK